MPPESGSQWNVPIDIAGHSCVCVLTEVGRVVVGGTVQSEVSQVRNQTGHLPSVDALTQAQNVQLKHKVLILSVVHTHLITAKIVLKVLLIRTNTFSCYHINFSFCSSCCSVLCVFTVIYDFLAEPKKKFWFCNKTSEVHSELDLLGSPCQRAQRVWRWVGGWCR